MARPEKEKTAPAEIFATANDRLNRFCGMTRIKKAVLSRLVVWFLDQPDTVRRVVLGEVTEGLEGAYADALEELARQVRAAGDQAEQPAMLEHDDIDAPLPDEESVKQRSPQRTSRPGKSGRRTGTPLPRARAVAAQAEPAR